MKTIAMKNNRVKHQSGAALVVALILLVALSLMAISSMNTASLDLIMAGNEQYRSRAFFAAEAGVERALDGGTFDSAANDGSGGTDPGTVVVTGTGSDRYAYTITRPNNGETEAPPPGNSEGQFGAIYFRIASIGTSERNSTAIVTQELFQVVQTLGEEQGYNDDACAGSSSLDATSSGC
ncbi:MAG: PilX N-terminal domain-containing pilus assembly protein [Steroidobacteraceae bacterium]